MKLMDRIQEVAENHRIPEPSTMLSTLEAIDGKILSEQEQRDRAYSHCGRWLLDNLTPNRHPILEAAGEQATVADWELLEVENPAIHEKLAPIAAAMLKKADIKMPFTPHMAEVHDLDEARARRDSTNDTPAQTA